MPWDRAWVDFFYWEKVNRKSREGRTETSLCYRSSRREVRGRKREGEEDAEGETKGEAEKQRERKRKMRGGQDPF